MKKKKDSIQLSKQEYYRSNENEIRNSMKVNYEENKTDKRQTMKKTKMLKGNTM